MAQTFFPITPVEVTPGTPNDWIDVNVSAYVPSGATGVILHCVCPDDGYFIGVRKNGSSGARYPTLGGGCHMWKAIGVDTNRIFEAYVESTTYVDIYLVGYTMSGVTFFTNEYEKSFTTTFGVWTNIDCSSEAPNAVGLIFETCAGIYDLNTGFRKNGSTDNRTNANYCALTAMIGCDTSQICEGWAESESLDFYLIGYITDGATFNTNATDVSLSTTDSWLDLTALPTNANMGFIEVKAVIETVYAYGLRKKGSSENIYYNVYFHYWTFVECDGNQIIEGKIENTNVDFFVVGYSVGAAVTEKTSHETGSGADAKITGNPMVALLRAEAGVGVETLLSRGLVITEAGSGIEHFKRTGQWIGGDVVSSRDFVLLGDVGTAILENSYLHILEGVKTSYETGSGVDSSSLTALFQQIEGGLGVEQVISRAIYTQEYPAGAIDLATVLTVALSKSDWGSGTETALVALYQKVTETGEGVDASTLLGLIQSSDAGQGIETALGSLYKKVVETGIGADASSLLSVLLASETGAGVETSLASFYQKVTETGAGVDVSTLKAMFTYETGAGVEAITLLAAMISHDTGVGVEEVITYLRKLIDSGVGSEVVQLIGMIGRAMKLITYLRAYSDLKVYTKPYSDLKVYTSEVEL